MAKVSKYKREFVYTIILFVAWQMAQVPVVLGIGWLYMIFALMGGILVLLWEISSFHYYSGKEISRFADVLIKIKLRERFLLYFILPLLFYAAITTYLYVTKSILLKQLILVVSTYLFYLLIVHIRSSYEKVFTIAKQTRVVLQFIDIVLFYTAVSALVMLGIGGVARYLLILLIAAVFLGHQLLISKQTNTNAFLIYLLSLLLVLAAEYFMASLVSFHYPLVLSILFYLIVSWWSVRLDGHIKLGDYIQPLLFSLMAFMIVVSF